MNRRDILSSYNLISGCETWQLLQFAAEWKFYRDRDSEGSVPSNFGEAEGHGNIWLQLASPAEAEPPQFPHHTEGDCCLSPQSWSPDPLLYNFGVERSEL